MPNPPIKVYIVDDEPSICAAYARLARSARMETQAFLSVEEFMKTNLADENACVICDVAMPGTSGLELPRLLKGAGRNIPVIHVTGYDTEENRAIAQGNGSAAYFRKPVDDQALLDAIAWALGRQSDNANS